MKGARSRNVPSKRQPDAVRRRYTDRIKGNVLEDAIDLVRELLVPELEQWAAEASKLAVTDARKKDLGDVMSEIEDKFDSKWTRERYAKVVKPVASDIERWSRNSTNKQLKPSVGVDVFNGTEPWLKPAMQEFTRENVALIKSIPDQFFGDLEKTIARELADGARFEKLADIIEERYGVAQSRAEIIARDQVGKFNADLDRVRQRELGITRYEWETSQDERVRPEHAERNGKVFEWDNPPEGGHPGEDILCRCTANPIIEDLL
jgi:SPP1 gp7 family putative phage head morphogenesis protein